MQKLCLQFLFSLVLRGFLKVVVGVRFQKLKAQGQFIIVANHNSHLDTMTLMASLPRQMVYRVKPVAAADHFGKTRLQRKLSTYFINTLLIERKRNKEHPESDPIRQMIDALDQGYSLIVFPEGTRGEPEKLQPFKPGIALVLSARPEIPYIPAFMTGMGKAMPKGDSLILPFNSTLVFGSPAIIRKGTVPEILEQIEQDLLALKANE